MQRPPTRNPFPSPRQARELTSGLAWLGIGLGLVKLLAARPVARSLAVPAQGVAACGARDLVTGAALLRSARPGPWLWLRAGAGALDALALARGARHGRGGTAIGLALGAVTTLALLDGACARSLGRKRPVPVVDYSDRSGFPLPPAEMTGAARESLDVPQDLRVPPALRPLGDVDRPVVPPADNPRPAP